MRKALSALVAASGLLLLAGAAAPSGPRLDLGPCDLETVLSGFWCSACQTAFEPDAVADHEYTCPNCGRTLEVCEICMKRVSEGDRERSDVARVVYRCDACGTLGDSEGPCPCCDGCGQRVRACSKSGTPPHASGGHPTS